MKKAASIILIFALAMVALSQAMAAGDIRALAGKGLKGKVVGQQLVLMDPAGKQVPAPDGVYTTAGKEKIIVQKGRIIEIDILSPTVKNSTFGIIEIDI